MSGMSPTRRRRARRPGILNKTQAAAIKKALLY